MAEKKSPSALVLPFGKHRGSTVAELLTKDPAYAEWIANQGWVAERFAELHAAILSRGAVSDDSPEHNSIQVRFLDETFRLACLMAAIPTQLKQQAAEFRSGRASGLNDEIKCLRRSIEDARGSLGRVRPNWISETDFERRVSERDDLLKIGPEKLQSTETELANIHQIKAPITTYVRFEERGVDVVISWTFYQTRSSGVDIGIEIKPTMGDDFPSVMRQMAHLRTRVLVVGDYTGRAVSEPQLRQMFAANNQMLLFIRDIEAEIANARADLSAQ